MKMAAPVIQPLDPRPLNDISGLRTKIAGPIARWLGPGQQENRPNGRLVFFGRKGLLRELAKYIGCACEPHPPLLRQK